MSPSVRAACLDSGFMNAGTPFEIASTPDSTTAPEENALRRAKRAMLFVSCLPSANSWAASAPPGIGPRWKPNTRTSP